MLNCGAAKLRIDPKLPAYLHGYSNDIVAREVHDSLYVAAMFLQSGGQRLALLTYDAVCFSRPLISKIRSCCSEATGLPKSSILLTVSHSHSTPLAWMRTGPAGIPAGRRQSVDLYSRHVVERSVKVLSTAMRTVEPARISYNTTRVS